MTDLSYSFYKTLFSRVFSFYPLPSQLELVAHKAALVSFSKLLYLSVDGYFKKSKKQGWNFLNFLLGPVKINYKIKDIKQLPCFSRLY